MYRCIQCFDVKYTCELDVVDMGKYVMGKRKMIQQILAMID